MTQQDKKYILYIGGAAAAYFLLIRPLLRSLGITKTEQEVKSEKVIDTYVRETLQRQQPTKSKGEWQLIADQIYADLRYSALDDNKEDATYQVARAKNDADVALLIQLFGRRREYLFGLPAGAEMNLQEFIRSNLSSKQINLINDNYSRKGIKYRF